MSSIIQLVNNKQSIKFEKMMAEWNSQHTNVTQQVEEVWTARMGKFKGIKNDSIDTNKETPWNQKPFVTVEIHHKEVKVYNAYKEFETVPTQKQLKGAFEGLYSGFVDHAKSMVMLKFLHYYDNVTEEPKKEVPQKLNLIKP